MRRWAQWVVAFALCGCASSAARSSSPSAAIAHYVRALEADDPQAAYALLAAEVRADLSFADFEARWRSHARERQLQASALTRAREASPDLGGRAVARWSDGKTVTLSRESERWLLDTALVGTAVAPKPQDAVRALARSLDRADFGSFTAILSQRKRAALLDVLSALSASLAENPNRFIQETGEGRAQMVWEDRAGRYRIDLVREEGEWRVDDFDVWLNKGAEDSEAPAEAADEPLEACPPGDPLCGL